MIAVPEHKRFLSSLVLFPPAMKSHILAVLVRSPVPYPAMRVGGLLRETLLKSEGFRARDLVGTFCDVDSSIIPTLSPTPWLPLSPRPTMSAKLREID